VNRLASLFKSTRTWGLIGTAFVLYLLIFVVFGKLDVSWIMPDTNQIARTLIRAWPQMPFFTVQKQTAKSGDTTIYYTVPTHQFTPQELRQMGVTNAVAHPATPK
jgi:hypothetical protein